MTEKTNLEQAFRRVESDFIRLRRLYLSRKLSQPEFVAELKKLRLQDETGRYWTIGAQSGKWYYFDGRNWVRADPPANETVFFEEDSGTPSGSFTPEVRGGRGAGVDSAREGERPTLAAPEVAALRSNLTLEITTDQEERLVIASLPVVPTAVFAGGLVTLLGVIAGAVVGSTSFFLGKLGFLPLFFQEIQGKLTGGFVFAGMGGLAGLFSGVVFGLLAALFFNLSSSLAGGLTIRVKRKKEEKKL